MNRQWQRTGKLMVFGLIFGLAAARGDSLQKFENARLLDHPGNDGDSFRVKFNGESFNLRLYYVDCPEVEGGMEGDLRRMREQARYWGLPEAETVIEFGEQAAGFVQIMRLRISKRCLVLGRSGWSYYWSIYSRSKNGR